MAICETSEIKIQNLAKEPCHLKIGGTKAFIKKVLTVYRMSLNSEDLEFHRFIFALQKVPDQRSLRDIAVIKTYLEDTDLSAKFRHDSTDEELLIKILYFCSMHMKYTYLGTDKTLFRIGDIGDKFFLILKGTIGIFKPISRIDKLTPRGYVNYLTSLNDENERFLLKLTINANMEIYPIDINDIDQIKEICFKITYRRILLAKPKVAQLRQIFENYQRDPKLYHLDLDELLLLEQNSKSSDQYFSIIQKQLRMINESNNFLTKQEYYKYIENELVQKFVSLFSYNHCLDLSTGKYFGDYALDQKSSRTATIKTMEDTHFGYLEVNHYNEFLGIERQKMKMKEMSFITDNFFFTTVNKKTFEEKYFQYFVFEDHFKGDLLIKENDTNDCIFFISEGDVELGITKSANDIQNLLFLIEKSSANGINVPWEECDKLKSNPKFVAASLNQKRCTKLFFTGKKENLGVELFYVGIGSLFHAKVTSEKLKLYKIEYKNLNMILQNEKECMRSLEDCAIKKLDTYILRVITIMNGMLRRIDSSDVSNLEEEKKKERKKQKYNNEFTPKLKTICLSTDKPNPTRFLEINHNDMITDHCCNNSGDNFQPQQVKIQNENRKSVQDVMPLLNGRLSAMDLKPSQNTCLYENHLMNKIKKEINVFQQSSLTQFKTFWKSKISKNTSRISIMTSNLFPKSSIIPSLTEEVPKKKSKKFLPHIHSLNVIDYNITSKSLSTRKNNSVTIQMPYHEEDGATRKKAFSTKYMITAGNDLKHSSTTKLSIAKKIKFSSAEEIKTPKKQQSTNITKSYIIGNEIFSNSKSSTTADNGPEGNAIVYAFHSRKSKISSIELLKKIQKNANYKKVIREKTIY